MVFEILEWMVFGRRLFRYSTFGYWRLNQSHQINIADHARLVYWHILEFGSISTPTNISFMDRFLISFMDRLLAFLMARALWFSSWHLTHIWLFLWEWLFDEQRHWNSKIIERHVDGIISLFSKSSRQHRIIRCNTSEYIFCHLSNPPWSQNKRVQGTSSQTCNHSIYCFVLASPLFSWDILFRWILFFSFLYRCFSLNDIRTMCGRGDEDEVVMKGWLALEIPIWRDVAFLWQPIFGDNFATIEMKYFFKDHGVTTHGK